MDFSKTSIVELAAILAEHLKRHGVEVVLVGGLAVEIYTDNLYSRCNDYFGAYTDSYSPALMVSRLDLVKNY